MKNLIEKTIKEVRNLDVDDISNEFIDSMLLVEIFLVVEDQMPNIDELIPEIRKCETAGQLINLLENSVA
ncbi:hypothetical protein [Vibrio bivalvicida]|uniref:Carrier domain-containing protein n=1 Tax=Vibrio bivalvicida TaxID=1276888 RepID=A0ABV4MII4_9VIBR